MLVRNLALAIGPTLLLLWWAMRRDSARPEPTRLVLRAFGLGIVAVGVAIVAGLILGPLDRLFGGLGRLAYHAYFVAGFLEEGAKLLVITFFISRHNEFDEVADGMVYAMAASLGFAAMENVLYLDGPAFVLLVRGLSAVPLHASVGGIMGYFIGLYRIEGKSSIGMGFFLAVAVHGTYDFFLFAGPPLAYLAIPLVVVALLVTGRLFRSAVRKDRRAGRIPPPRPKVPRSGPG